HQYMRCRSEWLIKCNRYKTASLWTIAGVQVDGAGCVAAVYRTTAANAKRAGVYNSAGSCPSKRYVVGDFQYPITAHNQLTDGNLTNGYGSAECRISADIQAVLYSY